MCTEAFCVGPSLHRAAPTAQCSEGEAPGSAAKRSGRFLSGDTELGKPAVHTFWLLSFDVDLLWVYLPATLGYFAFQELFDELCTLGVPAVRLQHLRFWAVPSG